MQGLHLLEVNPGKISTSSDACNYCRHLPVQANTLPAAYLTTKLHWVLEAKLMSSVAMPTSKCPTGALTVFTGMPMCQVLG